ncbi:MAG: hypothetical protein JNJ88_04630 [Planctomycetes bacterium]|nr:hypothetical protein [Planctomycetota bacterium]
MRQPIATLALSSIVVFGAACSTEHAKETTAATSDAGKLPAFDKSLDQAKEYAKSLDTAKLQDVIKQYEAMLQEKSGALKQLMAKAGDGAKEAIEKIAAGTAGSSKGAGDDVKAQIPQLQELVKKLQERLQVFMAELAAKGGK